jgi:hypothetical protein
MICYRILKRTKNIKLVNTFEIPHFLMRLSNGQMEFFKITRCLKIREFRMQSVVGYHFSSPNMEIKKNPPTKIHWSVGALFELHFLQIQAENFSVYCYL